MIYQITSRQNNKIKALASLLKSKGRKEEKAFLVEGFHMLEMALAANVVLEVYTIKELDIDEKIPQYVISEEILKKITVSKNAQGVVAKCRMLESDSIKGSKVLYLDDVADPGNVGTILRSALAFGYKDIIMTEKCASLYNDKVIASTQGAMFKLNIVLGDMSYLSKLQEKGYKVVSTSLASKLYADELPKLDKHILVVGNEGRGVDEKIQSLADFNVIIKIDEMESLNVAIATGIMLYILTK